MEHGCRVDETLYLVAGPLEKRGSQILPPLGGSWERGFAASALRPDTVPGVWRAEEEPCQELTHSLVISKGHRVCKLRYINVVDCGLGTVKLVSPPSSYPYEVVHNCYRRCYLLYALQCLRVYVVVFIIISSLAEACCDTE